MIWQFIATLLLLSDPPPFAAPQPLGDAGNWVTTNDLPAMALRYGRDGTVGVIMLVNEQGRVEKCSVVRSSGSRDLDEKACVCLVARGRYAPAKDGAGVTIAAEIDQRVRWAIPGRNSPPRIPHEPDRTLNVAQLPDGRPSADLTIGQIIAADGRIESCGVHRSSGIAAVDRMGCRLAADRLPHAASTDQAGNPIRALHFRDLRFLSDDGQGAPK